VKLIDTLLPSKEDFKTTVVPASIKIFQKLTGNKEKYEDASEEKVKRLVSPLLKCLIKEPKLYNEIVDKYGNLPTPAKNFVKKKFDSILKIVVKNDSVATEVITQLYEKMRASSDELLSLEYAELIELFKTYMRNQGKAYL